jgi:hypothetical protein
LTALQKRCLKSWANARECLRFEKLARIYIDMLDRNMADLWHALNTVAK